MQLDLFTQPPSWSSIRAADLPDLSQAKLIGIDTETRDPGLVTLGPGFIRGDAYVVGFSVAVRGWSSYIPLRHYSGNIDNPEMALRWLAHVVGNRGATVLGANLYYDLDALWSLGISVEGDLYDVQVVDSVIDETHDSYSLENIAQRRLGEGKRNHELKQIMANTRSSMSDMHLLEASYVAEYAIRDATLLLDIYDSQEVDITMLDLRRAVERENKLTKTLWKMHQKGIRIDVDRVVQLNDKWKAQEEEYLAIAHRIAGWKFKASSPKHLAAVLEERGILVNLTAKGNPTVSNEFLREIDDPLCKAIYDYRRLNKTRKDYCEGVFLKYLKGDRVYPQWFQSRNTKQEQEDSTDGASTGRITGSKPNITQIPSRSDIGKELRSVVIAEEGDRYVKLDYGSQEPRITLSFAVMAKCTGAAEAQQRFLKDKTLDYHQVTKELILEKSGMDIERRQAKDCNLGMTYGMQFRKLASKLGLDEQTARGIIDAYHKGVPFIREIADLAKYQAGKEGYIRTMGGRIRHFNEWGVYGSKTTFKDREAAMRHFGQAELLGLHAALNSAVQGTAADQMKESLIQLDAAGQLPLLQIYDETGLSCGTDSQIKQAIEIMENSLPMAIPALCEPEIGPSWGEVKKGVFGV